MRTVIGGDETVIRRLKAVHFVLLPNGDIGSELEAVFSENLAHVVAEGIGRVGVLPRDIARIFSEAVPISRVARVDLEARQLSPETILEQANRDASGALPRPDVAQGNVVGGVAEYELIQQRRRNIGCDPLHQADAGADEVGLDSGECPSAPEWRRRYRYPRIVDVAERSPHLRRNVVVNLDQLFPPGGGRRNRGLIRRVNVGYVGGGNHR